MKALFLVLYVAVTVSGDLAKVKCRNEIKTTGLVPSASDKGKALVTDYCPKEGPESTHFAGNYVTLEWDGSHTLSFKKVKTKNCPTSCQCPALLGGMLKRFKEATTINGFSADKTFMDNCRCYLGASAKAGYTKLQLQESRKDCNEVVKIDPKNYGQVCDYLERDRVGCNKSKGTITK